MKKEMPLIGFDIVKALPGFSCKRCTKCCRDKVVVLTDEDISRLKPHVKGEFFERTTKLEKEVTGADYKILMKGGICIFLKGNSCRVYEYRPDTCRRHPFLVTNKYLLVAKECPGLGWDRTQSPEPFRELSKGVAKNLEEILDRVFSYS